MKYSVILAALVAVVAAQDLASLAAEIPACAKPALDEAAAAVGCTATDYACQCGEKKQQITISASPKVIEACGTEAQQVLAATNALCEAAANAPAQESSSSAAESTTSSAMSSAASGASETQSSVQSSASGALASVSSEAAAKASEISSGASSVLGAATSAAAAATSAVAGSGAMNNAVNMGAMLGAAGVVAAMI